MKRIADEIEALVVAGYCDGLAPSAIAKRHNISERSVTNCVRRRGVEVRPRGFPEHKRAITKHKAVWDKWAADYRDGMSLRDLATKYGASEGNIHFRLNKMGVEKRRGTKARAVARAQSKPVIPPFIAGAVVYIIGECGTSFIKIGVTGARKVWARVRMLQVGNPRDLRILFIAQGGFAMERKLHSRFLHLRAEGEWFDDSGREIRTYLDGIADGVTFVRCQAE